MHQQARLTTNHPALGKVGDLVTIAALEQLFSTSAQANSGVGYQCANQNCGVRVSAVITVLSKAQRKNSPASYFAAKPKSHILGCSRQPNPTNPTQSSGVITGSASPSRTSRPVIWIDPRIQNVSGGSYHPASVTSVSGVNSGAGGRSRSGTGVSQGRSQMVESYAVEWLNMSTHDKQNEKLTAPWNPGGTYFSAFHPIHYYKALDVTTLGEKIFVGTINNVKKFKTGYVVTLNERNSTKEELWVWVQDATFTHKAPGQAVQQLLANFAVNPATASGRQIFALEKFIRQSSSNYTWSSLPVAHPYMIWIA